MRDKSGSVLMIVLWLLAILVMLAVGMGRRCAINLRLAKYQKDRLAAYYLAKAGINRAILELAGDQTPAYDSLSDGWADNEKAFKNISLGGGSHKFATVAYLSEGSFAGAGGLAYGVRDEERKINVNRVDSLGKAQLLEALKFVGLEEGEAAELSNILAEWIDGGREPDEEKKVFKNGELKASEELLAVLEYFYQKKAKGDWRSLAAGIFRRLNEIVTVYGDKKININTVSADVLGIVLGALAKSPQEKECVLELRDALIRLREEKGFFADPAEIEIDTDSRGVLALLEKLKQNSVSGSDFFRIEASGSVADIARKITAVFNRRSHNIVYWHQG